MTATMWTQLAAATPAATCRVISILFGLSIAVTFSEKLALAGDYSGDGWFPWRIFRFDRLHFALIRRAPVLCRAMFGRMGMSVALTCGLIAVAAMWLAPVSSVTFTTGVATIVAVLLLVHLRSTYGGDGSQQMNLVIGVALLLGFNPWMAPAVRVVSLAFIAAQTCLAYFASGASKLVSPIWTRGDPLLGIFATTAYGSALGVRLVSVDARVRRALGLGMVVTETLFPLAVVGPRPVLIFFLVWGTGFHLTNAVIMGLNTFTWSFLATYPAVIYAWGLVHGG